MQQNSVALLDITEFQYITRIPLHYQISTTLPEFYNGIRWNSVMLLEFQLELCYQNSIKLQEFCFNTRIPFPDVMKSDSITKIPLCNRKLLHWNSATSEFPQHWNFHYISISTILEFRLNQNFHYITLPLCCISSMSEFL